MNQPLAQIYLEQLDAEAEATRACLVRITDDVLDYKPSEHAMVMKHLVITVSDIPRWISTTMTGDIDFGTFGRFDLKSAAELPGHFDETMAGARKALENASDEDLMKEFSLKMNGKALMTDTRRNTIDSTIRHLVHHRGQLTVYMRMLKIPIPKIYGPSGDDQSW